MIIVQRQKSDIISVEDPGGGANPKGVGAKLLFGINFDGKLKEYEKNGLPAGAKGSCTLDPSLNLLSTKILKRRFNCKGSGSTFEK